MIQSVAVGWKNHLENPLWIFHLENQRIKRSNMAAPPIEGSKEWWKRVYFEGHTCKS